MLWRSVVVRRLFLLVLLGALVGALVFSPLAPRRWQASASALMRRAPSPGGAPSALSRRPALLRAQQPAERPRPGPTIEPYIRPEFARQMRALRPHILDAAQRHNRRTLSRMSDRDFAVVIAVLLYNENFGSLEEQVSPLRSLTPFYQDLQVRANEVGGANLSVWPSNLRPSVALEILRQQVPLPRGGGALAVPVQVAGSALRLSDYPTQAALYAAITQEIIRPEMAVEYLAANLERGLYRAELEGVPATWRALAAWHNQGVLSAADLRANPTALDYVRRSSAYLPAARALIDAPPCPPSRCRQGPGWAGLE